VKPVMKVALEQFAGAASRGDWLNRAAASAMVVRKLGQDRDLLDHVLGLDAPGRIRIWAHGSGGDLLVQR
jgi:hypothetical protein